MPKLLVTPKICGPVKPSSLKKGPRHRAADRVAELVEQREQQDHHPAAIGHELGEGRDRRLMQPLSRRAGMWTRDCRFAGSEHGCHSDQDERGNGTKDDGPRHYTWQQERHGIDDPKRNPISELGCRRSGPLFLVVQDLDAVGIDDDVLRCRKEGDGHRSSRRGPGGGEGIAEGERQDRQQQAHLRQQHPAPPAAEPAVEQRQRHVIDQRRPGELERIGRAHQGEDADGLQVDANPAHPVAEHRSGEQQWHAAREAHEQDGELPAVAIDRERVQPAIPRSLRAAGEAHWPALKSAHAADVPAARRHGR